MNKVYDIISDKILEQLDKGVIPWKKTWKVCPPCNGVTRTPYRGINILILSVSGYSSPFWFTYKQAKDLGGIVRKGEHGMPVVFWKFFDKEDDEDGKTRNRPPIMRYYTVFNYGQIDGLDPKKFADPVRVGDYSPIQECEKVVSSMPVRPDIVCGMNASYNLGSDKVTVPPIERFESSELYYSTLFHELAHSTMHEKRLDRKNGQNTYGSEMYGREELLAEIASAFLCGICGITPAVIENSVAYISGWKKLIKADVQAVVMAASQAQKASDFILNKTKVDSSKVEEKKEICTV